MCLNVCVSVSVCVWCSRGVRGPNVNADWQQPCCCRPACAGRAEILYRRGPVPATQLCSRPAPASPLARVGLTRRHRRRQQQQRGGALQLRGAQRAGALRDAGDGDVIQLGRALGKGRAAGLVQADLQRTAASSSSKAKSRWPISGCTWRAQAARRTTRRSLCCIPFCFAVEVPLHEPPIACTARTAPLAGPPAHAPAPWLPPAPRPSGTPPAGGATPLGCAPRRRAGPPGGRRAAPPRPPAAARHPGAAVPSFSVRHPEAALSHFSPSKRPSMGQLLLSG